MAIHAPVLPMALLLVAFSVSVAYTLLLTSEVEYGDRDEQHTARYFRHLTYIQLQMRYRASIRVTAVFIVSWLLFGVIMYVSLSTGQA